MKILQIARRFLAAEWGGTETVIAELSRELIARRHYTELWCSSALAGKGQAHVAGVPVRRFDYSYPVAGLDALAKRALDKKGGNLVSASMMAALLAAGPWDVYHTHAGKRLGAEAALAARIYNRPLVLTLHGGAFDVPPDERQEMLEPIRGKLEWGKVIGALLGSRSLLQRADAVLCVNPAEAEFVAQEHPEIRVRHLPNGVTPSAFSGGNAERFRKAHNLPLDAALVTCISRIDPQKNQAALVRACARLMDHAQTPHVVLIGPVTRETYAQELLMLARDCGIGERLHILEPLAPGSRELADAFAAADVFVLPSRHEPFGIVVLEAWSAGRAVIGSRVGGLARLIEDGVNGLSFEPNNDDALAAAIGDLLDNPDKVRRLGEAGRAQVAERYTWSRIADDLETLYRELIEARS